MRTGSRLIDKYMEYDNLSLEEKSIIIRDIYRLEHGHGKNNKKKRRRKK